MESMNLASRFLILQQRFALSFFFFSLLPERVGEKWTEEEEWVFGDSEFAGHHLV
jgi:hypothetical protein